MSNTLTQCGSEKNLVAQLISAVVITYGGREVLKECLQSILQQGDSGFEVVLVDNNLDDTSSRGVAEIIEALGAGRIRYFKPPKNLGVAEGRNYGALRARGEILVFVDDDATLQSADDFLKIRGEFCHNPAAGILSFKIIDESTGRVRRAEFPHTDKSLNPDSRIETSYFIGAGYAVRKEIFQKVGPYPADFFYAMEELDFSFRVLDAGLKIIHFPDVVVRHKRSLNGRLAHDRVWRRYLENRVKVGIRNLPWWYVFISSAVWAVRTLLETADLNVLFDTARSIWAKRKRLLQERKVIKPETVSTLKKLKGRLYY